MVFLMSIIVKRMHIIVHKCSIRRLSLLYARLPVDPGEGAFFTDTYQSFLCGVKDWNVIIVTLYSLIFLAPAKF
jgi:hypothetical protein